MKNQKNTSSLIGYLVTALFFFVSLLPVLDSVDIIAPQWLYLSILNIVLFTYFETNKTLVKKFNYFSKFYFSGLTVLLVICAISVFFAQNLDEAIIELSRVFIILSSLYLLYSGLQRVDIKTKYFYDLIIIFLIIEMVAILIQYMSFSSEGILNIQSVKRLTGFTGNKNIASIAIAIKIPFLVLRILKTRSSFLLILQSTILVLSFYIISILTHRTTFIILLISVVVLLFYSILNRNYFKVLSIYILPLIFAFSINYLINSPKKTNNNVRDAVVSIAEYSESNSAVDRIRYYMHSLEMIKENPFFGIGIGNWKIESLKYEASFMSNYIVPYHAHNDLLQKLAEIGIFGGIVLFLILFLPTIIILFLLFKKRTFNPLSITTVLVSIVFFFDFMLNFPLSRPIILIPVLLNLIIQLKLINNLDEESI